MSQENKARKLESTLVLAIAYVVIGILFCIFKGDAQGVKNRSLCAPGGNIGKSDLSQTAHAGRILTVAEHAENIGLFHLSFPDLRTVGSKKNTGNGKEFRNCIRKITEDLQIKDTGGKIRIQRGAGKKITDGASVSGVKIE